MAFAVALLATALLAEDQSIRGGAYGFFGILGVPILLLVLFDTGRSLRKAGEESARLSFWGRVLGYPQAACGLVCAIVGVVTIPLLLYKWWSEGQAPVGRWIAGPIAFFLFGVFLMRDAFRPPRESSEDSSNGI